MSKDFKIIDVAMGDSELYYHYMISITRNSENKITIIDGNCLLREYGFSFKNLEEEQAEHIIIQNFAIAGPDWPEDIKKLTIEDCENSRGNCPNCNNSKYKSLQIGMMCLNCATIKQ